MKELSFEALANLSGSGPESSDGRNCFWLGIYGPASVITTGGASLIWLLDDMIDCVNDK